MGHTLKLVRDTDEIDFTAGVYTIKTYVPQSGSGSAETVTESAQIIIEASSTSTLQDAIRDIEKLFTWAKDKRQSRIGERVYVTFSEDGDATIYQSEIYAVDETNVPGRVVVDPSWMKSVHWDDNVATIQVTWERKNYWEKYDEDGYVELPLDNGSQAKGTGGCQVFNPNTAAVFTDTTVSFTAATNRISDSGNGFGIFDAGDCINLRGSTSNDGVYTIEAATAAYITVYQEVANEDAGDTINIWDIQNYVDILGSDIDGTIPTPLGLYSVSATGGDELESFWIYANRHSPTEFPHILDTEDSDSGAQNVSALCVSGFYNQYSVTTTYAKLTGWTLSTQLLEVGGGAYFRVLGRFFDTTDITNVKLGFKILTGTTVIYEGGKASFDDTYASTEEILREIDTLRLPPFERWDGEAAPLTLQLWGVSTTGSTETINLDCLFLLPTDGWLKLKSLSGIGDGEGIDEQPWQNWRYKVGSSGSVPDVVGIGGPIMLYPGQDIRIYFNYHTDANATAEINRELTIIAVYLPRIVSI